MGKKGGRCSKDSADLFVRRKVTKVGPRVIHTRMSSKRAKKDSNY